MLDSNLGRRQYRPLGFGVCLIAVAGLLAGCSTETQSIASGWWLTAPPTGTELELEVSSSGSSCTSLGRVDVTETADEVKLEAYVEREIGGTCTADAITLPTEVSLAEPLGARVLTGCVVPGMDVAAMGIDDPSSVDCTEPNWGHP